MLSHLQNFHWFVLGGHKFHHTGEAAGIIEPLDPKLSDHLKSLILSGYNRPRDLQRRATEFVRENFPNDATMNPYRRRYFPSRMQVYVILDLYSQQIIVGCLTCEWSEKVEGL